MSEYSRRWESLRDGYLPPSKLDIDPSVQLHVAAASVDPITYEVLRSRLWSINWDHQETIKRISGSGVVVYAEDFETTIQTEDGDGAVFGPGLLTFAGYADLVVKWTLEHRSGNVGIGPGDVFIQDDPWVGTNHQMDTAVYAPVFVDGRIFCWVYNSVHQQELGGVEPGGFVQQAKDTYWEATAFPPIKLIEAGRRREDLFDAWVRRSRLPQLCRLELKSQIAGVEFARARVEETVATYGPETVKGTMRAMIDNTERAVASRLKEIPDGTWRDRRYIAGANPGDRNIYRLELAATKRGSKLSFTNAGTDPAVGSFNIAPGVMRACILAAALPLLAFDQYLCGAGVLRCIEFEPALGTITSARHPSAISTALGLSSAVVQCQYLLNKMMGAAPSQRGNIFGASAIHTQVYNQMFGVNEDGQPYTNFPFDAIGGGCGAFAFRDGINHGGGIISTLLRIGNVEEWERDIPFLYLFRREVKGGGGHGKWRGGTGLQAGYRGYRSNESFISSGGLFQSVTQGHGLSGGLPGSGGTMWSAQDTDIQERFDRGELPATPAALREIAPHGELPPAKKFDNRLADGDLFEVTPPLGAGHGDPLLRDPELVLRDFHGGHITPADARRIYGVVVDDGELDLQASRDLRADIAGGRLRRARPPRQTMSANSNGASKVVAYALETVAIVAHGETYRLDCSACGHALAPVDGNYRLGVAVIEDPLADIDPHVFLDPLTQVDEEVVLRRYLCPGCGLALDADIVRPNDEIFQDVQIDSLPGVEVVPG